MVKIKEVSVNISGKTSLIVTMPKVFVTDNKLKRGDKLEVFRTSIDGIDGILYSVKKKVKK